jgi:hypothetical protein
MLQFLTWTHPQVPDLIEIDYIVSKMEHTDLQTDRQGNPLMSSFYVICLKMK